MNATSLWPCKANRLAYLDQWVNTEPEWSWFRIDQVSLVGHIDCPDCGAPRFAQSVPIKVVPLTLRGSQLHCPGLARVCSSFVILPQNFHHFSYFSSSFPHFGPTGGWVTHPRRPWLRYYTDIFQIVILSQVQHILFVLLSTQKYTHLFSLFFSTCSSSLI